MARQLGYADTLDHNASRRKQTPSKPTMSRIEITPAHVSDLKDADGNALHQIEIHMKNHDGPYIEPEKTTFKQTEGKEALAHIGKHMKVKMSAEEEPAAAEAEAAGEISAGE
jgi:hypothetical protein